VTHFIGNANEQMILTMNFRVMLLLVSLGFKPLSASRNDARELQTQSPQEISTELCGTTKIQRDSYVHKDKYIVGVVPTSRAEETVAATTIVFQDYLTATAGQMFNPPISFEVKVYDFVGELEAVENQDVDFLWANSGDYSCVGTQFGATALVTVGTSPSFHLGCCTK
jgi:hypothetical protein